ncbi:MAG TPA: alpha/beta fold hydrolase [Pyrinomonadaceae bacterium]|nr:alpha/beta fold hydrolase [Pyrinomonadaceae bacterium]
METIKVEQATQNAAPDAGRESISRLMDRIARSLAAKPFRPHPMFRNGHAQTIMAYLWPRRLPLPSLREDEARLFEVEPGVRVLVHCRWQTGDRRAHPTLLLVHGLEGSSESVYMMSTTLKAYRAGFHVLRFNIRSCGGTHHLTPTLYNSGMSQDLRALVEELITRDRLPEIFLAGFSLGGNLSLKLAGEYADAPPAELKGVCVVSPSIELAACADAIERRSNWLYSHKFVTSLKQRMRDAARLYPERYDTSQLKRVRTIRDFDSHYTAPFGGFRDVDDYYARASSLPLISRIRIPTLIIHAQDDPFIPFDSFRHSSLNSNPYVILLAPRHGGHVGFVADDHAPGEDRFWAENRLVEFCRLLKSETQG